MLFPYYPSTLVFHSLCLCPSLLSHPLYILPEAFCQLSWEWTERYPTRLMPATLHCANNGRTTRNAYMSCTRLPRCQITALALDRQEQKNTMQLIPPHAHTHLKTSGWTRLLLASAADGICFRGVRLSGSVGGGWRVTEVKCFKEITYNIYSYVHKLVGINRN